MVVRLTRRLSLSACLCLCLLVRVLSALSLPSLAASTAASPLRMSQTPTTAQAQARRRDQVANFLAGGLAGTVSSCLTIPLEVVKTQLQSSSLGAKFNAVSMAKHIWRTDGPKGFVRGLQPMLVGIIPTRAIYFWAYAATKDSLAQTSIGDSSLNHLLSAFSAGIASNTVSNPLWMVRTRFQLLADQSLGQRAFTSYGEVVRHIWKEEGMRGFFKGLTASYIGCLEGAVHWIIYERLKTALQERHRDDQTSSVRPAELFLAAAASKFCAICLTYPHEVVRTRLREQASHGVFKYSGALQTFVRVYREEGAAALYRGLGMHLLRSVPNAAIMFVTFEVVGAYLKAHSAQQDEAPAQSTAQSPRAA